MKFPESAICALRCPVCHHRLEAFDSSVICNSHACGVRYPVLEGVPVLLNESSSVFSFADVTERRETFFQGRATMIAIFERLLPTIDRNLVSEGNYTELARLLAQRAERPRVLVLGAGSVGEGMQSLINADVDLIESDVSVGERTSLVCDAHDIPFVDNYFDAVVVQAVLEHVVDPTRCVREIYRVLKSDGYIYAETPFMQQVHGGAYDFTRFTALGHRWLFRNFEEIESGASCGPGMALAWSYQYFLLSFTTKKLARMFLRAFARLTAFPLKYFDRYLLKTPGALDAASGVFFLGRKSDRSLAPAELIKLYRGAL